MKFMRFPEAKAINRSTSSRFAISKALRIIVGRGSRRARGKWVHAVDSTLSGAWKLINLPS